MSPVQDTRKVFVSNFLTLLAALALNLTLFLGIIWGMNFMLPDHTLHPWETESKILIIPENKNFDLLILGNSKGEAFSSHSGTHQILEETLAMNVLNLSYGHGGGVIPAQIVLSYFYQKNNSAKKILIIFDPLDLYEIGRNEHHMYAVWEPLRWDFFMTMMKYEVDLYQAKRYLTTKFSREWFKRKGYAATKRGRTNPYEYATLSSDFLTGCAKRKKKKIGKSKEFKAYSQKFLDLVDLAHKNGSKIYLGAMPHICLPKDYYSLPQEFLDELQIQHEVTYKDFSMVLNEDLYFFGNPSHINTEGVRVFTRFFLKQFLTGGKPY